MKCDYCGGAFEPRAYSCTHCGAPRLHPEYLTSNPDHATLVGSAEVRCRVFYSFVVCNPYLGGVLR
jgi:hypothetical protein